MRYEILLYLVFYNKNGFDNQIYQISLLIYEKRKERMKKEKSEINCLENLISKYVYTLFYFILINMRYGILLYLVFYNNKKRFDNQIYQISLLIYEKRKELPMVMVNTYRQMKQHYFLLKSIT